MIGDVALETTLGKNIFTLGTAMALGLHNISTKVASKSNSGSAVQVVLECMLFVIRLAR